MDTMFWITLGINAVVTLFLGVVAILIAPVASAKLSNYLYTRQVSRSLKQKQEELRNYERIKAFHLGTKDRQFYYVYLGAISSMCFIAAATCIIALAVTDARALSDAGPVILVLFIILLFTSLMGLLILAGMKSTATNLENFEEYEKRVKERWPDA